MKISFYYFLGSILSAVAFSLEYDCQDRQCFISTNELNEKVFDCKPGVSDANLIQCSFVKHLKKITLTTKNESYIDIDKVSPGAFKRLTNGIEVNKIFINKLRMSSIGSADFDGLMNIAEMQIENPKILDKYTFYSLATTKTFFILTIICSPENNNNSFQDLLLKSSRWRLYSKACNRKRTCEIVNCESDKEATIYKITASNEVAKNDFQLISGICEKNKSCKNPATEKKSTPKPVEIEKVMPSQPVKSAKLNIVKKQRIDRYYDTLLWIVIILTGINSFVILGILVFLIIWWRKLSLSATNKKHTIVLEDDDTKYLKLTPYA